MLIGLSPRRGLVKPQWRVFSGYPLMVFLALVSSGRTSSRGEEEERRRDFVHPSLLCGRSLERFHHRGKEPLVRVSRSHLDPNPAAGLSDASSDLEELESQGAYLSTGKLGSLEGLSEQPEERVGSCVEKQAKLVGQEAVAAQPIGLDFPFEFFDPVLRIAPEHIDRIIDPLGIETEDISDNEPLIRPLVHVLGLGNHPAIAAPRFCSVGEGAKQALLLPCLVKESLCSGKDRCSLLPQSIVGDETNHVVNPPFLTEPVESGHGEPGIGSQHDLSLGVGLPQSLEESFEHRLGPMGGMSVTWPEYAGERKAAQAIEDEERMIHVLFVIAMKETQLLVPMGRIVGRVDIEHDHLARSGMGFHVQREEPIGKPHQVFAAYPVLKARKRGLRGQIPAGLWQAPGNRLQRWVASKRLGIVAVFIAKGDGEDPLLEQGDVRMNRLARISGISQTPRSARGNPVTLIEQPKNQSAGIRGDATTFEVSGDLLAQDASQTQLFMADCSHKGILAKELYVVWQQHFSRCPSLFEPVFVHNPG